MVTVNIDPATARKICERLEPVLSLIPDAEPGRMKNGAYTVTWADGDTEIISEWDLFTTALELDPSLKDSNPNEFGSNVAQWN